MSNSDTNYTFISIGGRNAQTFDGYFGNAGGITMKRIILVVLAIVFMTNTACALMLGWDRHTQEVQGYLLQWEQTNSPPETFSINVPGIDNVQQEIADNLFEPGVEYSIWVRAYYESIGESIKSNVLQFIRSAYTPPADNVPTDTYDAPGAVINFINQ